METKQCYACGKSPLSKDEIGLVKKLIDKKAKQFYCLSCLADYFEVTEEELLAKRNKIANIEITATLFLRA